MRVVRNCIAKTDIEIMSQYADKSVTATIEKRKYNVYFQLIADIHCLEQAINMAVANKDIIAIECYGDLGDVSEINTKNTYIFKSFDMDINFDESDILKHIPTVPKGVSIVFNLPEEYKDVRFLYNMLDKYDNIRFAGCNLFWFEGYSIGYIGKDTLENSKIKYDTKFYFNADSPTESILPVYDIRDLDLEAEDRVLARQTTRKVNADKPKKPSKVQKFSSLLFSDGDVEL